ncbi:MAG: alpha/beta hydrolase [Ktedonobacterales bacterium]|nr:alpha/beta hydrolase [Ktedonobacterales bacterium]
MPFPILLRRPPRADQRIAYGPERYQFGDLRLPTGTGPHAVAMLIHGGYWRARYNLTYLGHIAAALTRQGIATWNIEYRRLGNAGGGWPGTFLDVALAADFLRTLAPTAALDLARVVAVGHSAGGHLGLWLAGRARIPAESALACADPLALRAAVALAGVVDLRRAWELRLSENVTEQLLGGTPELVPERYAAASPYALLPLGPRQVLIHGTRDDSVPYELSERYVAAAQAHGDAATLISLAGAGHFELVDPKAAEWPEIERAVRNALA